MRPGDVVADRFLVEAVIEAGGMGIVFRAYDRASEHPVALKILKSEESAVEVTRFDREARLLAELHHPAIVDFVGQGLTTDGRRYLAMEWLDGNDLATRLASGGMTMAETMTLVARVASALGSAHAHGVVHRDIKPSNIFLPNDDVARAKVLDFGIARLLEKTSTLTQTGFVLGTPGYMAPEQVRGERVDPRADVFSLGCVVFECLTGTRPFAGDDGLAVMIKILLEEAPRLRERVPDLPASLDIVVARMLAKSREERPRDGGEVLRLFSGLELPSSPPSPAVARRSTQAGITTGEQRFVCVVLAATPGWQRTHSPPTSTPPAHGREELEQAATELTANPAAATPTAAWSEIAHAYGARLDVLGNGSVVATLVGEGSATDRASQAVRCALALRAAIPLARIAVATGRRELMARLPVGEAIDRAAALVGIASSAPSRAPIRIDDVTAGLVDARFDVATDGSSLVVSGERTSAGHVRTLLGKPTRCVGREREVNTLVALFSESEEESVARVALVTAPPGVGKSRLRDETLRKLAQRERAPQVWVGTGDPMRAGSAFGLLSNALRAAAGVLAGEALSMSRDKIAAHVARSTNDVARRARITAFIGELAGVPFDDGDAPQLRAARSDPLVMGDQMRLAFTELLACTCENGPLVIVLEDVHWGDLPSTRCIDEALKVLADRPLFVLALARPEIAELFPGLWSKRVVERMTLAPLTKNGSEKLVLEALGPSVPPDLLRRIVERADGNAFYLEELVRAVASGKMQDELPETVLAMVEAHLDRLHPDVRLLLRGASVFGETFWRSGVDHVLGGAHRTTQITDWYRTLIDDEVIAKAPLSRFPATEEYVFRHGLLRDGAYGSLTVEDRTLAHRLAGEWLAAAGEHEAIVLAEHFERGGVPERAVDWFKKAAREALEGDDLDAALLRVERGLRAGATGESRGELQLLDAEVHIWRNDHAGAAPALEAALTSLARGSAGWCKAAAGVLVVHAQSGDLARLTAVVRDLREVEPALEARGAYVMPAAFVVSYACALGMYGLAESFLNRLVAIGSDAAEREPVVQGWLALARRQHARFVAGRPADFVMLAEATASSFARGGDLRNALLASAWWAHASVCVGDFDGAEKLLRRTLPEAEQKGLAFAAATARVAFARVHAHRGHLAEAQREANHAILSFGAGNAVLGGFARTTLAAVLHRGGALDDAEREARAAATALAAAVPYRAHALAWLARILVDAGRADEALRAAEEAAQILDALGGGLEDGESLIRLMLVRTRESARDSQGAWTALERAAGRLHGRSSTFALPEERARFLALTENAETVVLAQKAGLWNAP